MFIFGHLGVGSKLASPWSAGLPKVWLLFGTLLPDIIDKPLYYGVVTITGFRGADAGLISGTRTFGHTGLLLLAFLLFALARRSKTVAAVALGMATHLLLDNLGDRIGGKDFHESAAVALLFPAMGVRFPLARFAEMSDHLAKTFTPFAIGGEVAGVLFLGWDWWKTQHAKEILAYFSTRRLRRKHSGKKKS